MGPSSRGLGDGDHSASQSNTSFPLVSINMAHLKQTSVFRSGLTASVWNTESTNCTASIDKDEGSLNVHFDIASKGGGTTCLWVKIGSADVRGLLHELAEKRPETAGTFAECISLVIQLNAQMLEKIRDPSLIEKLESVAGFVDDKYNDAPPGEDDVEKVACDNMRNVVRAVESLQIA